MVARTTTHHSMPFTPIVCLARAHSMPGCVVVTPGIRPVSCPVRRGVITGIRPGRKASEGKVALERTTASGEDAELDKEGEQQPGFIAYTTHVCPHHRRALCPDFVGVTPGIRALCPVSSITKACVTNSTRMLAYTRPWKVFSEQVFLCASYDGLLSSGKVPRC